MAPEDTNQCDAENKSGAPEAADQKPTKVGKRPQKDPLKPKKPKSAYLFFGEATRNELAQANPGMRMLSHLLCYISRAPRLELPCPDNPPSAMLLSLAHQTSKRSQS